VVYIATKFIAFLTSLSPCIVPKLIIKKNMFVFIPEKNYLLDLKGLVLQVAK
jgi:hypothetical protein